MPTKSILPRNFDDLADVRRITTAGGLHLLAAVMAEEVGNTGTGRCGITPTLESVQTHIAQSREKQVSLLLATAIQAATKAMLSTNRRSNAATDSFSVVLVIIHNDRLYAASTGENHIYLVRNGIPAPLPCRPGDIELFGKTTVEQSAEATPAPAAGGIWGNDTAGEYLHLCILLEPGDTVLLCSTDLFGNESEGCHSPTAAEIAQAAAADFSPHLAIPPGCAGSSNRYTDLPAITVQYLDRERFEQSRMYITCRPSSLPQPYLWWVERIVPVTAPNVTDGEEKESGRLISHTTPAAATTSVITLGRSPEFDIEHKPAQLDPRQAAVVRSQVLFDEHQQR